MRRGYDLVLSEIGLAGAAAQQGGPAHRGVAVPSGRRSGRAPGSRYGRGAGAMGGAAGTGKPWRGAGTNSGDVELDAHRTIDSGSALRGADDSAQPGVHGIGGAIAGAGNWG